MFQFILKRPRPFNAKKYQKLCPAVCTLKCSRYQLSTVTMFTHSSIKYMHSGVMKSKWTVFLTSSMSHFMVKCAPSMKDTQISDNNAANTPHSMGLKTNSVKCIHTCVLPNKGGHGERTPVTRYILSSVLQNQKAVIHTSKAMTDDENKKNKNTSGIIGEGSEETEHDLPAEAQGNQSSSSGIHSKALSFLVMVDMEQLNASQQAIHKAHLCALQAGEHWYSDPSTGYHVMTRLAHLERGECCGNACRHCPYGQKNAPEHLRRPYNSAFYD